LALIPGTRLGPYEVSAQIGVGGMGEVYRATDTNLKRAVAIKILPESVAADAERLARFQREAEVLASLNHPHIAAIYGLERSDGITALVMELVEGPTLADRIAQGPIPVDETLPIAKQIAEALEAAHEQGIIHRDLKPANIKVRADATVKVLDFGLAKAMEPPGAPSASASMSPTITTPAMTQAGMILGTAAYMSPEQAKGRAANRRSDVWSFGCVLYEMLTGRRAFEGEDVSDTLASVLKSEPDWNALPADVAPPIRTLLQRCLVKDPQKRVADIAAARFVLDYQTGVEPTNAPAAALPKWRRATTTAAGIGIGALLAAAGVWFLTRPAPLLVVRTTITTSGSATLAQQGTDRDVAITPDGSHVVYRGNNQLLLRALNQLEPAVLSDVGAPQAPFVSPDGKWVGFFDGTTIKKVAITGGSPVTIANPVGADSRGATWGPDGTIVFATSTNAIGLQRVSDAGNGAPTLLTTLDRKRGDADHVWPQFLPGGQAVLFTIIRRGIEESQIAVLDLQTGTSKVLIPGGSDARYIPTGHLIYGVAGTLRAVAFDLERLEISGTAAPVLEGVVTTRQGAANISVAANGSLVYVRGVAAEGGRRTVALLDREGRPTSLAGLPPDTYRDVRVSPDGTSLALSNGPDVSVYDFSRGTLSRLTTDTALDRSPLWTPNGQRIIFTSMRAGYPELFWRPADGSGRDDRFLTRGKDLLDLRANGWSPDGKHLLFTEVPPTVQNAIGQIAIDRPSDATLLIQDEFSNDLAAVSPDGGWMAYQSTRSGRSEIYVQRYPELGNLQQISTAGGRLPLWSGDGRKLFFSSSDGRYMFAVAVQSRSTLVAGRQQVLFEPSVLAQAIGFRPYDLAPDGRFVIIPSGQTKEADGPGSNLILVENWFEEVKRLMPAK
jgi:serine/threonine protein kinase/dipeptidyl aminopeptidase/acylaminoacyl peptidase